MRRYQKIILFFILFSFVTNFSFVAREANVFVDKQQASNDELVVLLKNEKNSLPLVEISSTKNIVLLIGADSLPSFSRSLDRYAQIPISSIPNSKEELSEDFLEKINLAETIICVVLAPDKGCFSVIEDLSKNKELVLLHFYTANYFAEIPRILKKSSAVLFASKNNAASQSLAAQIIMGGRAAKGGIKIHFPSSFEKTKTIKTTKTRLSYPLPSDVKLNSELEDRMEEIVDFALDEACFPACQLLVAHHGEVIYEKAFGTYRFDGAEELTDEAIFDLASVTKATATLPAIMLAYEAGKIDLNQELGELLPYYKESDKGDVKIRELLNHSSGIVPTINFFTRLIDEESYSASLFSSKEDSLHCLEVWPGTWVQTNFSFNPALVADSLSEDFPFKMAEDIFIAKNFIDTMRLMIASSERKNIGKYKYSCVNFILLRELVETAMGKPMDSLLYQSLYSPIGAATTCFNPRTRFEKTRFVPAQNDLFLRKQELIGFVDDESAACFGGVSGNAGLFSDANDLAKLYQMFLNGGVYGGKRYFNPQTIKLFTQRDKKIKNRSLGFAMPRFGFFDKFKSKKRGRNLYGHTGFTGTCVWVDPDEELIFVFLSNRTYPSRTNTALSDLSIRSLLLEAVYSSQFKYSKEKNNSK